MAAKLRLWARVSYYARSVLTAPHVLARLVSEFDAFREQYDQEIERRNREGDRQEKLQLLRNQVCIANDIHRLREDLHTEMLLLEARLEAHRGPRAQRSEYTQSRATNDRS